MVVAGPPTRLGLFESNTGLAYKAVEKLWPVLRTRPCHEREDWHQIALLSLWRATEGYDPTRGPFCNLAIQYMRTALLNEVRAAKPRGYRKYDTRWDFTVRPLCAWDWDLAAEPAEVNAARTREVEQILDLAVLDDRDREIFYLRYWRGLSYLDCAQAIGMSAPLARHRDLHALAKVRRALTAAEPETRRPLLRKRRAPVQAAEALREATCP